MRLSSIIVFAAFVLLASAFPINGNSRRSNHLWRRVTGNPEHAESSSRTGSNGQTLDHTHPDGTFIQDDEESGISHMVLRNERAMNAYSRVLWGPPTPNEEHHVRNFTEARFRGFYLRNFYGPRGLELSYLSRSSNGNWMTSYPTSAQPPRQRDEPNYRDVPNYTTSRHTEADGTYVQRFFKPHEPEPQEVLSVTRDRNGQWTVSGDVNRIQWLSPPPRQAENNGH